MVAHVYVQQLRQSGPLGHVFGNSFRQSKHIGQWATPHHRRLGGIGRVVPIEFPKVTEMAELLRLQLRLCSRNNSRSDFIPDR